MGQTNTINEMHLQNSIIPVGPLGADDTMYYW